MMRMMMMMLMMIVFYNDGAYMNEGDDNADVAKQGMRATMREKSQQ